VSQKLQGWSAEDRVIIIVVHQSTECRIIVISGMCVVILSIHAVCMWYSCWLYTVQGNSTILGSSHICLVTRKQCHRTVGKLSAWVSLYYSRSELCWTVLLREIWHSFGYAVHRLHNCLCVHSVATAYCLAHKMLPLNFPEKYPKLPSRKCKNPRYSLMQN